MTELLNPQEIISDRRDFLRLSGSALLGSAVVGGAVVTTGCGKNISLYTATIIGSLEELSPLLPNLSPQIHKAVEIAKSFDAAYRDGKFADAGALFTNLTTIVSQIATATGITNPQVKIAIAVGGVALRAIGVLLKTQTADPIVAAAVAKSSDVQAKAMIQRMGDPVVMDRIVQLVMP